MTDVKESADSPRYRALVWPAIALAVITAGAVAWLGSRSAPGGLPATSSPPDSPSPVAQPPKSGEPAKEHPAEGTPSGSAPTLPHRPAAPSAGFAAVEHFLAGMRQASAAFQAPAAMFVNQAYDVRLVVSPTRPVEKLLEELRSRGPQDVTKGGLARIAPRMEAHLVAEHCGVTAIGSEQRAITGQEDVEWRWRVTPNEEGQALLGVVLEARVEIDGAETPYLVRTFEETIQVRLTRRDRLTRFVKGNYQWLWTLGVPPWLGWLLHRRKTRRTRPARRRSR